MSIRDIADAFNAVSGSPGCSRVTMKYAGENNASQLFAFYVNGRSDPIEVLWTGVATPDAVAAEAHKQV